MKIIAGIAVGTVLLWIVVVWVRPWARKKPWAAGFFAAIEPFEIFFYGKSETLLKARAKMVLGLLLTSLTQIGTLDLSPLMPLVPDQYATLVQVAFNLIPLIITVGGWVDEKLRDDTTKPLVLVSVAAEDMTPAVVEAIENADAAKIEAVAVVTEQAAMSDASDGGD